MTPPEPEHTILSPVPGAAPGGWLKLYRCLMAKPIWTETSPEQKVLLLCLLMKANYRENEWIHRGVPYHLKPGQLITSIESLMKMGGEGLTHRKVRSALALFEKLGFLTMETSNRNTLITIVNWAAYQAETPEATCDATHRRHTDVMQTSHSLTTNKKLRSKEGEEGVDVGAGGAGRTHTPPRDKPGKTAGKTTRVTTAHKTGFHLPESRGSNYTNDELEALLQEKRKAHREKLRAERGGA
ncbi:MAG: hypothetical protein SCK57_10720 [Bacillota bacterium]|nr:hypothetical protein [Bacillota bacterium]MDW7678123.1 hypothetical protein [Bacillota bacterium]